MANVKVPARHGLLWSEEEHFQLLDMLNAGKSRTAIAEGLERSTSGVEPKAVRFGFAFDSNGKAVEDRWSVRSLSYQLIYDRWLIEKDKQACQVAGGARGPTRQNGLAKFKPVALDYGKLEERMIAFMSEGSVGSLSLGLQHPDILYKPLELSKETLRCDEAFMRSMGQEKSRLGRSNLTGRITVAVSEAEALKLMEESRQHVGRVLRTDKSYSPDTEFPREYPTSNPASNTNPKPKETTMNSSIHPKSFEVSVKTQYTFNGQSLNYANDVTLYGYIKQVENQINELKAIETSSAKKAAEITGLRELADTLAYYLDNRAALQDVASVYRNTVNAPVTATDTSVKELEAQVLQLQGEVLLLRSVGSVQPR